MNGWKRLIGSMVGWIVVACVVTLAACSSPCGSYVNLFCEGAGDEACRDWKSNPASETFVRTKRSLECKELAADPDAVRAAGAMWKVNFEKKQALGVR